MWTLAAVLNLKCALDIRVAAVRPLHPEERADAAYASAAAICDEDVALNRAIGEHGLEMLRGIAADKQGGAVNVLTHCNAGWLATVDYGTALAPLYLAHDAGIALHAWVVHTRPRKQGAGVGRGGVRERGGKV